MLKLGQVLGQGVVSWDRLLCPGTITDNSFSKWFSKCVKVPNPRYPLVCVCVLMCLTLVSVLVDCAKVTMCMHSVIMWERLKANNTRPVYTFLLSSWCNIMVITYVYTHCITHRLLTALIVINHHIQWVQLQLNLPLHQDLE